MSKPAELDWRSMDLAGATLIEASAGTGKTYNIALLYLRLLIERGLAVRQILVTTFTEAAAQELKARIRLRLLSAETYLTRVGDTASTLPDIQLTDFLDRHARTEGRERLLVRLRTALADIDLAPISTIHGFCRRVLTDFPFNSGAPFVLGEIVDEPALVRECVQDYWRLRFLGSSADDLPVIAGEKSDLQKLTALVEAVLAMPDARVLQPASNCFDIPQPLRAPHGPTALRALLADTALFNMKARTLRSLLETFAAYVERNSGEGATITEAFEGMEKLTEYLAANKLEDQTSNDRPGALASHPLIQALQRWVKAQRHQQDLNLALLSADAVRFVAAELPRRLEQRRETTFSRLIETVHERLHGAQGEALARHLADVWPAALIDEFQDTDGRQWEIFRRIHLARMFHDPSTATNVHETSGPGKDAGAWTSARSLILIGDPKQSIYAFRGGDIHTYLGVCNALPEDRILSIRHNYRSHPELLTALNRLYALASATAFAASGIKYVEVQPGEPDKWTNGNPPLQLRLLQTEANNKGDRDEQVLTACANDIATLLNRAGAQDKAERIAPGQIAVLLDTNAQIRKLRAQLIARGVPVVGAGKADVLNTEWADDLQLLLHALIHPNDSYALRGALATRLLGMTAAELSLMAAEESRWERQLERFAAWRALWDSRGILAAIEAIVLEQAPRLLSAPDGERALTDLRHIGEVLQEHAAECFGGHELYARLIQLRRDGADAHEAGREMQLRIESEAQRVQLLTIHASKGLEFPVVFVPMAWRYRKPPVHDARKSIARFHDSENRRCLDLGSADFDAHKLQEQREGLQERMRQLYVAVTRAVRATHLYAFDDLSPSEDSTDHERGALEVLLGAALHQRGSWEALATAIPGLAINRENAAESRYREHADRPPARTSRAPLPDVRPYYGLYSFSSLVRHLPTATDSLRAAEDEPAFEQSPVMDLDDVPHPALVALQQIKGPRFGNAVHDLLESGRGEMDFALQTDRIAAALEDHAVRLPDDVSSSLLTEIATLLDRTVQTQLAPGLRLAHLSVQDQRAEFEFAFSLEGARWDRLPRILAKHGLSSWWPASGGPVVLNGLMKGFVDLVFAWDGRYHVLDYKTNFLGVSLSDYGQQRLEDAMQTHHYGLQALLYSVALHRYLGRRLDDYAPARDLGDCWYVFVRAVGLSAGAGIWRRRFSTELIEEMDRMFETAEVLA